MVENLAHLSFDEATKFKNLESSTQMALAQGYHSLLSCNICLQKGPMQNNH
jgi:hypothetical protein